MRFLLGFCLLLMSHFAMASDYLVKVIDLNYKTVEQVIPLIKPMLDSGASISGQDKTMIVKTTPENLTQIRYILHKIDKPPVSFSISIKQASNQATHLGSVVEYNTLSQDYQLRNQRVKVMNGQAAFINTQKEVPVISEVGFGWFSGVAYQRRAVQDGFWVEPNLTGNKVKLTIYRLRERIDRFDRQQFNSQTIKTTMMVPLGKWVSLGSTQSQAVSNGNNAYVLQTGDRFTQTATLYIKVDLLTPKRHGPTK
jgi:hypothetical protein